MKNRTPSRSIDPFLTSDVDIFALIATTTFRELTEEEAARFECKSRPAYFAEFKSGEKILLDGAEAVLYDADGGELEYRVSFTGAR